MNKTIMPICILLLLQVFIDSLYFPSIRTVLTIEDVCSNFDTQRIIERQNTVVITDRMWARLLSSTNQPSFLNPKDVDKIKKAEQCPAQLLEGKNCKDVGKIKKAEQPPTQLLERDNCKDGPISENHADNSIKTEN